MPVIRRFLIAPSLARLIRRELGSEQVIEGHFAPQADRQSYVRIEHGFAHLILTSLNASAATNEERTEVPLAHAQALLEVCPGTLTIERSRVPLQGQIARVDRFARPGTLDLVSMEFSTEVEAAHFVAPAWFGTEVTYDDSYVNRVMAISHWPSSPETEATNVGLEAVLDIVEGTTDHATPTTGDARSADWSIDNDLFVSHAAVVVPSASSLPPVSVPRFSSEESVSEARPRRPVIQSVPREQESERLAGVIEGLSSALAAPENEPGNTNGRSRPSWRRSSQ